MYIMYFVLILFIWFVYYFGKVLRILICKYVYIIIVGFVIFIWLIGIFINFCLLIEIFWKLFYSKLFIILIILKMWYNYFKIFIGLVLVFCKVSYIRIIEFVDKVIIGFRVNIGIVSIVIYIFIIKM